MSTRARAMSNPPPVHKSLRDLLRDDDEDDEDEEDAHGLPAPRRAPQQQQQPQPKQQQNCSRDGRCPLALQQLFPLREDTDAASEEAETPSTILPTLLLGNSIHGCSRHVLDECGVTHVLCVEEFFRRAMPGIAHLHVPMSDAGNTDLAEVLPKCIDFLEDARKSGGRALCHCFAGINRSATVVLAYLVKINRMTLRDAWCLVKTRRPIVAPNTSYRMQLIDFEEAELGHPSSMTLESWATLGVEACKLHIADQLRRKLVGITVTASLLPPIRTPGGTPAGSRPQSGIGTGFEVVGRVSASMPLPQVNVRMRTWPTSASTPTMPSTSSPPSASPLRNPFH